MDIGPIFKYSVSLSGARRNDGLAASAETRAVTRDSEQDSSLTNSSRVEPGNDEAAIVQLSSTARVQSGTNTQTGQQDSSSYPDQRDAKRQQFQKQISSALSSLERNELTPKTENSSTSSERTEQAPKPSRGYQQYALSAEASEAEASSLSEVYA